MTILLIASIFFIALSLILLKIIKNRNIKGRITNRFFPIVLRIVLVINIITIMIPLVVKISSTPDRDDSQIADEHLGQVIEAIESRDKETLRTMFSKQALEEAEDLDGRMEYLFEFVQGNINHGNQ